MILMNFVWIAVFTPISNKCRHSKFFIQNMSHHLPLVSNYIEICDIYDIIPVHLIFDIHSLRICCTAEKFNLSHIFFVIAFLLITFGSQFSNTGIRLTSTNSAVRGFVDFRHYRINPCLISFESIRLTFFKQLIFWKQSFHFIVKYAMCQCSSVFFCENLHSLFKASNIALFCHSDDLLFIRMTEYSALVCIFIVEHVMFHYISSFFFIIGAVFFSIFFKSHTDNRCYGICLLFVKGFKDILDCLFSRFTFFWLCFFVFGLFRQFRISFLFFYIGRVIEHNVLIPRCLKLFFTVFAMRHNKIHVSTGICSSQYKTEFPDVSVDYVFSNMF